MPVQPPWFLAASTAKSNSGGSGFIFLILIGFALLYLFTRSQKKARSKAAAVQGAIEVGSRVITTSGMYGTVVRADDTTYDLEVDTDVIITFAKAAVTRLAPVVASDEPGAAGDVNADDHDHGDHDGDHDGDHEHDHGDHVHGDGDHDHVHDAGEAATVITSLTKEPRPDDPARSSSES